jgi:hypothetical protein
MAESALSLGYADIAQDVAEFLGYDDTVANLGTDELRHVQQAIDSGSRLFLTPIDPRTGRLYDWNFLHTTTTITTASGTANYALPDDFGFHEEFCHFPADTGLRPVRIVGEGEYRRAVGQSDESGYPRLACIRDDGNYDGTDGQRFEIVFYPEPDRVLVMVMPYKILASLQMRTATPYPLGGMAHAETIRYACLASAELDVNDEEGPRNRRFKELLIASIDYDKRLGASYVGYNSDRSVQSQVPYEDYNVLVNGVLPS